MDVTVITPSRPDRVKERVTCCAQVGWQTHPPVAHLVGIDHARSGPAELRTRLTEAADTDWVAFVDDDDHIHPDHLATLIGYDADVIYPWCRLEPAGAIGEQFYNNHYDREALRTRGIFPITVLARRTAVLEAGGFRAEDRYEDWALWNRMADRGARFECVPEVTWTYRFHGDQRTHAA